MQQLNVLEHQAGNVQPDIPHLGNHFAKTAAYTIVPGDSSKTFSNTGAGGSVTFTLPAVKIGRFFRFVKVASQTIVIVPTGTGVKVDGGTTALTSETAGTSANLATVTVACLDGVNWHVIGSRGVWTPS